MIISLRKINKIRRKQEILNNWISQNKYKNLKQKLLNYQQNWKGYTSGRSSEMDQI